MQELHRDRIIYVILSDRLLSLSVMFMRVSHVVTRISTLFLFMAKHYFIVCIYSILCIRSIVNRHLGYFSALMNSVAVTERVYVWGPTARYSEAHKQARLVEIKVCFISNASMVGRRGGTPIQRPTSPALTICGQELS